MEKLMQFLSISVSNIIWCVILIAITAVLLAILRNLKDKLIKKLGDTSKNNVIKQANVVTIIYKIIKYSAIVICGLMILQISGVNVTSILAGVGIASVLSGIMVQDLFKDLIQGMRIVTDDFFSVGDYIEYNKEICRVIGFSARTTTLKDVESEDIINICNRNIVEVRRLSGKVLIYIPLAYRTDTRKADEIFQKSVEDISNTKGVKRCEFCGLDSYEGEKAIYLLTLKCHPGEILHMRRTAQRVILDNIYAGGLEMPVGEIDIINN